MLKKYLAGLALTLLALSAYSLALAAEVSVSQIQAQFNQTSVQYSFLSSYPVSMKESPPTAVWTSNLPCGSLVKPTNNTVVWDMADGTQLPKCPFKKEGSAVTQDGIIYLDVKASNGEEYNCTYEKGSRTGLGATCGVGPVKLTTQARPAVKYEDGSSAGSNAQNNSVSDIKIEPGHTEGKWPWGFVVVAVIIGGVVYYVRGRINWNRLSIFEPNGKAAPKDEKKKNKCQNERAALEAAQAKMDKARSKCDEYEKVQREIASGYSDARGEIGTTRVLLTDREIASLRQHYARMGGDNAYKLASDAYLDALEAFQRARKAYQACMGEGPEASPQDSPAGPASSPLQTPPETTQPNQKQEKEKNKNSCEDERTQKERFRIEYMVAYDKLQAFDKAWGDYTIGHQYVDGKKVPVSPEEIELAKLAYDSMGGDAQRLVIREEADRALKAYDQAKADYDACMAK